MAAMLKIALVAAALVGTVAALPSSAEETQAPNQTVHDGMMPGKDKMQNGMPGMDGDMKEMMANCQGMMKEGKASSDHAASMNGDMMEHCRSMMNQPSSGNSKMTEPEKKKE